MSKVTNKFLSAVPALTLKGNNTDSTTNPTDLTVNQVTAMLTIPAQPLTESDGTTTIDWSTGDLFTLTLNANLTVTFANALSGQVIRVEITNTSSNYTITWPWPINWPGGTPPTQTGGAVTDVYTFIYNGSTYTGFVIPNTYPQPFPNTIPGLLLYLDPTLGITQTGSNQVTGWADQSGNANNAVQSTPINAFINTPNIFGSNPGLLSDTANSTSMTLTNAIEGLSEFTIILLVNPTSASTSETFQYLGSNSEEGSAPLVAMYPSGSYVQYYDGDASFDNFALTQVVGTPYLMGFTSGNRALNSLFYLNNNASASPTGGSGDTVWNAGLTTIGGDTVHSRYCDVYFGPILVYNSSLTSTQMTQIYNWYHNNGWI
jgi:hypothetical protein